MLYPLSYEGGTSAKGPAECSKRAYASYHTT
jgi:hypothetical protein